MDKALLAEMQKKIQKEMIEREERLLHYWKAELEKVHQKRHESLAALQLDVRGLIQRMETRIRLLRKEARP